MYLATFWILPQYRTALGPGGPGCSQALLGAIDVTDAGWHLAVSCVGRRHRRELEARIRRGGFSNLGQIGSAGTRVGRFHRRWSPDQGQFSIVVRAPCAIAVQSAEVSRGFVTCQ